MMNDLIFRNDAIEALGECPYNWTDTDAEIQAVNDWEFYKVAIEAVPSACSLKGEVNAVEVYERESHNFDQGYITLGEFDRRIEPLKHLYYDRPKGEWLIEKTCYDNYNYRCSYCDWYECHAYPDNELYNFCPNCGARMEGVDDE